ncbi:cilia- and flagella-associated protein 157 [Lepisosteus oculatus]|uniref:cilia- and flagella-associated protein 157 n=1 Tax=Lepisosteus oculatus TaxID=7918 RepID=UPI00371480A2
MPPKKKGKKSGEQASKKEKDGHGPGAGSLEEPLSELSKEFYRVQIRDLEDRLERYQRKCDELEVREKDFGSRYERLAKDKREIVSFLKRTLDQRADELADLADRLLGLQQAKEAEKDSFEAQLAQLRHEFQESKDQLTSENMVLAGKLASLEEFRVQKEELMAHLASLEEQLTKQKQEHQAVIYNLERKAVLDNDRLKKEMLVRVAAVAAEFRRVSDRQMAETTKRMIRENASVTAQLGKLSDKSLELLEENQALREQQGQSRQELGVLELGQKELARKSLSNQKVVLMLTEKCKQQQAELEEYAKSHNEYLQLQADHKALQQDVEAQRQELALAREERERKRVEAEELGRQLEGEKEIRAQLQGILQEAAHALQEALTEAPSKEADAELAALVRRSQMMQKLLTLLDSAALLGIGPTLQEFRKDAACFREYKTGPERAGILSPLLKAPKLLPHYRIGDLGLVPRPKQTLNTALSKVGPLSSSTRFNLQRRPPGQPTEDTAAPEKPAVAAAGGAAVLLPETSLLPPLLRAK